MLHDGNNMMIMMAAGYKLLTMPKVGSTTVKLSLNSVANFIMGHAPSS